MLACLFTPPLRIKQRLWVSNGSSVVCELLMGSRSVTGIKVDLLVSTGCAASDQSCHLVLLLAVTHSKIQS